jgi:hypothetical protein
VRGKREGKGRRREMCIQSKVEVALLPKTKNLLKLSFDSCLFPNFSHDSCGNILA